MWVWMRSKDERGGLGMLLAVDIGNSHSALGLFEGEELRCCWRVTTESHRTADEIAVQTAGLLRLEGLDVSSVKAMIVSSDLIVGAVAAYEMYGGPCVVVDFGTATTFAAVSKDGEYLGGAIAPGIEVSMDALWHRAAKLSRVELVDPGSVIGKSTMLSMQSGAVYGFGGQVDGIVERMRKELGGKGIAVATGGLSPLVFQHAESLDHLEPLLTLRGLRIIYQRNT